MNTAIANTVAAANDKAQYDEYAKRLIAQKIILAHILAKTVDEFRDMKPEDIVAHIEGDPKVGIVPVDPGMTNASRPTDASTPYVSDHRLAGLNTEHSEINEGMIRFDIIFYVRMKDGLAQVIINIEIQKRRAHPVLSSEQGDLLCQPHGFLTKRKRFRPSELQ